MFFINLRFVNLLRRYHKIANQSGRVKLNPDKAAKRPKGIDFPCRALARPDLPL